MEQFGPISMTLRCGVAVLKVDSPGKENVLSDALTAALGATMESLAKRDDVNAVLIISAKPNSFIAGADIAMLETAKSAAEASAMSRNGQQKFQAIEEMPIPVVAAIMGSCMGGGLELALACHYRIGMASDRSVFSFPEVRLGLLPGAGGTQRLPRLVSLPGALDMMLSGRAIDARKAKQIGILDVLLDSVHNENDEFDGLKSLMLLEEIGIETALRLAAKTLKVDRRPSLWDTICRYIVSSSIVWNRFIRNPTIAQIRGKGGNHYPAPFAILKCIEAGILQGPSVGYATESEEFGHLTQTNESKALIGLFHASTKCKKQRFGSAASIKFVAIIGASEVGIGLVGITARKNLNVILVDEAHIADAVTKGKMSRRDADATIEKIAFVDSISEIKNADAVIVALEFDSSYDFYREIIAKIEAVVGDEVPIAVNCFGRSLEQICATSKRPQRILAVFYVMPVERSEYVELIAHKSTNRNAIATVASLIVMQKKLMLLSRESDDEPGYYVVQCILAAISELDRQICEGYLKSALDIDKFSRRAGFMIGFAEIADLIGLDVVADIAHRWDIANEPSKFRLNFMQSLIDSNRTGKKCGRGFYSYSKSVKLAKSDDHYNTFLRSRNTQVSRGEKSQTDEVRQARLIIAVSNAALRCFEKNIISSPVEGDAGCVFGIGFPPFLGGPFRFVDQRLEQYTDAIREHSNYCDLMKKKVIEPHVNKFYE
ncbi:Trifunctional enzyme subunit alpha, mitochondrial [Toxocara canis]|uniref:enoyl-CoA hydratase n=1 Tax=Toxocara canis TaxID=6265 RepID=A0A0B2VVZ8_TOXCA|nr:Trifunctional enzyme subunit alpha, mitochondrial [Toxocara canis]